MKKFKSIIASITVAVIMCSGTVSASLIKSYESGSKEYEEYRSTLESVSYKEKLGELLMTAYPDLNLHNVYYMPNRSDELFKDPTFDAEKYTNVNEYEMEIDDPNKISQGDYRRFVGTRLYFNQLYDMDCVGGVLPASVDEMNEFLKSNGYNALIEVKQFCTKNKKGLDKLHITYGDEVNTEGMVDILYTLYKKYGLEPHQYLLNSIVNAGASLSNWEPDDLIYYDTLGDANNDNTLNVRDCSFIAQALATGKGTDLPDSADYNKDGNKNVRDAAEIARELASAK